MSEVRSSLDSSYARIVDTPGIVHLLLWITIAATTVIGATFWVVKGWQITTLSLFLVALISFFLLYLHKVGSSQTAGFILYLIVSSVITFNISIGHGIYDEGMLVYPLLIVFSGLIFGKRSAVLVTGITIAQMSLVYLLAQAGQVQPFEGAIQMPLEDTITTCIILMATGYLVWVIIDIVESAVERIYTSESELENAYNQTLIAWAKALELRNRENLGHSARVSSLTRLFAEHLSLDPDEIMAAWQGALLHDIGKMGISEGILLKPEGLEEEERRLVQSHPGLGSDLIQGIDYLAGARNVVNWHHERFDGTGFPEQLQGDQIPLIVQIFSVVDCWDTIRTGRPCRQAVSDAEALAFIKDQAGGKFNPMMVDQFSELVDKFKLVDADL